MSLVIPDDVRDRVNGALDEGFPMCMVAVSSDSQAGGQLPREHADVR